MENKVTITPKADIDIQSKTWLEIKRVVLDWAQAEANKALRFDSDIVSTSVSRGAYAAYQRILALEDAVIKANQQAFE